MAIVRAYGQFTPEIAPSVFIADTAAVVGDVRLAEGVSVWYGAALRGDVGKIEVGARTNIQDNATIHMTHELSDAIIGADVIVGHNAVIHGAIIEDHALIGMGAIVMDNARVGAGAWIAAGSVVPPRAVIPAGMLARGAPAQPVRPVKPEEQVWAVEALQRYLALAAQHALDQKSASGR